MRVVFFGTPAFAVPTLQALLAHGHVVVGVVTQPDRPQGRSRSAVVPPPVKVIAEAHGIPVLQPERPRGEAFAEALRALAPDIAVVVAYGHILRPDILAIPPLGMVNVHASLLPRHRGAAPVQAAMLSGDAETGVTIMRMDAGMDTGPMLLTRRTPITDDDTAGLLTERLAVLGAGALIEALEQLGRGDVTAVRQPEEGATLAPKIDRARARVEWSAPAAQVARQVQAFDPVPGAWTALNGAELKLFGARPADRTPEGNPAPGTVLATEPRLVVATQPGAITLAEVQPAGKRRMPAVDWCRGSGARAGDRFA